MFRKHLFFILLVLTSLSLYSQPQRNDSISRNDVDYVFNAYQSNYDSLFYYLVSGKRIKNQKQKYAFEKTMSYTSSFEVPDSVIIKRLKSIQSIIPMTYNIYVRNYIEVYVKKYKNSVNLMLSLSEYYFPIFEQQLDRAGVPDELKYLTIIESALNPNAVSRAGASGLWQFMHGTGKLYDLRINSLVDERRDPIKSSTAAANYLRDLYKIYNDWTLAIAAYNCGPGNINKAIRRAGGKTNYWDIYEFLPQETRGYVPAYIAATYIMHYYKEHGIYPTNIIEPELTDTVMVNKNIHFEQIAGVLDISMTELRIFNPQYKSDIIPGESEPYPLKLPIPLVPKYIGLEDSIVAYKSDNYFASTESGNIPNTIQKQYHKVQRNETWAGIATRYGVSSSDLKKWNGLQAKRPPVGRRLIIYIDNPLSSKVLTTASNQEADKNTNETEKNVKEKTTNSKTEKTSSSQVEKTGQTARKTYTIKAGDSLYQIALRNNMSLNKLLQINNMTAKSSIKPGQKIYIQ